MAIIDFHQLFHQTNIYKVRRQMQCMMPFFCLNSYYLDKPSKQVHFADTSCNS